MANRPTALAEEFNAYLPTLLQLFLIKFFDDTLPRLMVHSDVPFSVYFYVLSATILSCHVGR